MEDNSPRKNSSRRDLLWYAGLAGFVGFTGFKGLKFGSEPAIAAPTGSPSIADGTVAGGHLISSYDIEYQNLDTSTPIKITYVFTDSGGNETTSTHSVSLSGEPGSGTISTGSHTVIVPSGDIQLGIEVSHPSLSNTLSTSPSSSTTVLSEATISDDGATVSDIFSGETFAGSETVSSYNISYNGLDTNSPITVSYVFTDSSDTKSINTHTVGLSGKSESDTVSTGSHNISVPEGTLELDIKLSHASLENPEITNVGSIGEVYPNKVDAAGGTTVVDRSIDGQDYRIHAFEDVGNDTFTVKSAPADSTFDVLLVGGGGGGGATSGGGGGAGGVVPERINLSSQIYSISVGSGGAGCNAYNSNEDGTGFSGSDTEAFGLTALGGGGGGGYDDFGRINGGSGGGPRGDSVSRGYSSTGTGLQPNSDSGGLGNDGGGVTNLNNGDPSSGGGGAGASGETATYSKGGDGGIGYDASAKFGTSFGENGFFGGGGGGSGGYYGRGPIGLGGQGGGGDGGTVSLFSEDKTVEDGKPNTGGGGGGNGYDGTWDASAKGGGKGGSGIVLIRYKI